MGNTLSSPSLEGGVALFVDDDADVRQAAALLLRREGMALREAATPSQAWSWLAAGGIDVVLLDLNLTRGATSGEEGLRLLAELIAQDPDAVVVVVTAHSGVAIAVKAMRAGAVDFITKPWSNTTFLEKLAAAVALRRSRRAAATASGDAADASVLLGESAVMTRLRDQVRRVAPTAAAVLIHGEAGVGKSLVARLIHRASPRSGAPLVELDLATIEPGAMEAALFGEAGAFARAEGGTLVLDEVGDLTPSAQGRLLAAVQHGTRRDDVRLVSLSRRSPEALQGRGGLQRDLLDRLQTVELHVPPLSARDGDTLVLAAHFLGLSARRHGLPERGLTSEAALAVSSAPWPGQVRALRQAMERAVIFAQGPMIEREDLALEAPDDPAPVAPKLSDSEKALVAAALRRHGFNVSRAAADLGLTRAALYRRMAKHGL